MSQQSLFTTVTLNAASAANIYVQTGFTPGRIELINLTQLTTPTGTNGYKALWQTGMAQDTSMSTIFKAVTLADTTTLVASNGISLLNQLGSEQGQYGAVVNPVGNFTNANPGVITVDSTSRAQITAGCIIRVSLIADDQTGTLQSLNGDYYVASVTATTITVGTAPAGLWAGPLNSKNTSVTGTSVYVSGGVVTLLQTAAATTPNPPFNIYSDVPDWWNEAIQGFVIGTSVFANANYSLTTPDVILVSAWDQMQP